jgi:predicted Zn-dependent protease
MPLDPRILDPIAEAVQRTPHNLHLRLHLASLLLEVGRAEQAVRHCRAVLEMSPEQLEALELLSEALAAIGDEARAQGYRRLREALAAGHPGSGWAANAELQWGHCLPAAHSRRPPSAG